MRVIPILFFTFVTTSCLWAQQKGKPELIPARGHYKQLALLTKKPERGGEKVDQLTFPYDSVSAERRLSFRPVYLETLSIRDFIIPDMPSNSSQQTRAELNYLLGLQAQRTGMDIQNSLYMAGVYYNVRTVPGDSAYQQYRKNLFFIGRSMGTWFHPDSLPQTANLMANVWRDANYFIWALKYKYARVRPYVLEPLLNNLEETNWAAYPSGHAANSYINAYLYSELAPEFTDVFIKDAYDMAHSREIIGVHFPSDSEASRIFARQFVNRLFETEKFVTDFRAAKKEWEGKARESLVKPVFSGGAATPKSSCAKTCN